MTLEEFNERQKNGWDSEKKEGVDAKAETPSATETKPEVETTEVETEETAEVETAEEITQAVDTPKRKGGRPRKSE